MSTGTVTRPYILDDQCRRLVKAIAADPAGRLRAVVTAPGGYGKTRFLAELAELYRRADVALSTVVPATDRDADAAGDGKTVLLIDDANLLSDAALRRLLRLAESELPGLIIAHRPQPVPHAAPAQSRSAARSGPVVPAAPAALAQLTAVLTRETPPLVLGAFGRESVGAVLTAALGGTTPAIPPALVDFVHAQTGGVPRLVEWLVDSFDGSVPAGDPALPDRAIARFQAELDRLDPAVQRLLLAMDAGVGFDIDLLGRLLGQDSDGVAEVMAAARATGLLGQDGALLPLARRALRALSPLERRVGVQQRLAELQLERGGPVLAVARSLLGTGIAGTSAAAIFERAAVESLAEHPAQSAELFAAAVAAGRPVIAVAPGWAQAAALSGELDVALRLADQLVAAPEVPSRAAGGVVAAAALAHRGQLARSAELSRWSGTNTSIAFASIGLIGTGRLADGRQLLERSSVDGPPTLLAGAASLSAHGVRESVTGTPIAALSMLVRSAALLEPAGRAVLLPDTPAALAALVGLHAGELDVAASVLDRAVTAGVGGALMLPRHRLLQGWIAMMRGRTALARQFLTAAEVREPRDRLFAVALDVGLARRDSDAARLRRAWGEACEAIVRHPVDLFTLLPLAELIIAAARLGDHDRLAPYVQQARSLLAQLGDPPLWTALLHWSGFHAAVILDQLTVAAEHSAALAAGAGHSRYGLVASAAAESWLEVLAGRVDAVKVEAAARGLHSAGLSWDAARLTGQAAIRTPDRKAMVTLLDCARLYQGRPVAQKGATAAEGQPAGETAAAAGGNADDTGRLSGREQQVAELVLAGLTYRQIGDRLFISAKTVEHHVARMRNRLGCTSRSDLLAKLRELAGERGG